MSIADERSLSLSALGHAYAISGAVSEAEAVRGRLLARARDGYVSPYYLAVVEAGLGHRDAALDWLEQAARERDGWLVFMRWDPRLDPVRTDPRFSSLLETVGA